MKPYKECPICKSSFRQVIMNSAWLEEVCSNFKCDVQYRQYFYHSFEDEELKYIQFRTKNFTVYSYFHKDNIFPGEMHVYYRVFPKDQDTQMPLFKFKNFPIDFNHLDKLDEKFKTLNLFT